MLTGDSFSSSTFAVELGKFQVETVQSVSGLQFEDDVVEVRQVRSSGKPVMVEVKSGVQQPGEIQILLSSDEAQALVEQTRNGPAPVVTINVSNAEGETLKQVSLSNASATLNENPNDGNATVTLAFKDINTEG
ncbi:phage tail protein [Streptomyces sp. NPDC056708]|uniref:phage tail protein n=1 Tax=unclassified Streptomyces TaxID=2593676 RepID=UPI0036AF86A4